MPSGRPIYEPTPDSRAAGLRFDVERLKRRAVPRIKTLNVIVDGSGAVIQTGVAGDVFIDFDCQIVKWTLMADVAGNVEVDIWKTAFAAFPPSSGDSITSAKPTLTGEEKSQDGTLTGWTIDVSPGDCLRFNIDSADTITRLVIALTLQTS